MTIGVLIITHEGVGDVILHSVVRVLGMCPLQTEALNVPFDCSPEQTLARAREAVGRLDGGAGVLVLTDLCGATPANIARRLAGAHRVRVVTGLNLPMLVRVMNYPQLDLEALAAKAVSGGRDGVVLLEGEEGG